jgi:hypothetical protein
MPFLPIISVPQCDTNRIAKFLEIYETYKILCNAVLSSIVPLNFYCPTKVKYIFVNWKRYINFTFEICVCYSNFNSHYIQGIYYFSFRTNSLNSPRQNIFPYEVLSILNAFWRTKDLLLTLSREFYAIIYMV